jgi:hypothetical protein
MDGHAFPVLRDVKFGAFARGRTFAPMLIIESNCAGKMGEIKEILWRLPNARPGDGRARQNNGLGAGEWNRAIEAVERLSG